MYLPDSSGEYPYLTPERKQLHEAGHCAGCLAQGLPVYAVDLIGNGEMGGWVLTDKEPENADAEWFTKTAVETMCALIEGSKTWDDLPQWPLDSRQLTSVDEQNLAYIARRLGWSERDYVELRLKALRLMETDTYRLIFGAIVGALDYTPRLDQRQIDLLRSVVVKRLTSEDDD